MRTPPASKEYCEADLRYRQLHTKTKVLRYRILGLTHQLAMRPMQPELELRKQIDEAVAEEAEAKRQMREAHSALREINRRELRQLGPDWYPGKPD